MCIRDSFMGSNQKMPAFELNDAHCALEVENTETTVTIKSCLLYTSTAQTRFISSTLSVTASIIMILPKTRWILWT